MRSYAGRGPPRSAEPAAVGSQHLARVTKCWKASRGTLCEKYQRLMKSRKKSRPRLHQNQRKQRVHGVPNDAYAGADWVAVTR